MIGPDTVQRGERARHDVRSSAMAEQAAARQRAGHARFVICHLTAHCLLLVSFEDAEATRNVLMYPWRTWIGTAILITAFLVHYTNALWSIYVAALAAGHALGSDAVLARIVHSHTADIPCGGDPHRRGYVRRIDLLQHDVHRAVAAVSVARGFADHRGADGMDPCLHRHPLLVADQALVSALAPDLFAYGLLLPTLALAGYVTGGNQVLREAKADPDFVQSSLDDLNITSGAAAAVDRIAYGGWALTIGLALLPFAGRGIRDLVDRRRRRPMLAHANGRMVAIFPGSTVLETLRANGIAHAAVCGGRARCTTCRVLVTKGLDQLPAPSGLEAKALARIGATPGMRLACQVRPTADIAVMPLLAADASAADGTVRGGLEGSERLITVVFVDMRGSTTLGEAKLPYDVLFILNQFFHAMTEALVATGGHYSQFTGDGLMALYGLDHGDPASGRRCPARRAADAGAARSVELPAARRFARAAAHRYRHPPQRSDRRRDGAAAIPDHHRYRRHREYVCAA